MSLVEQSGTTNCVMYYWSQ